VKPLFVRLAIGLVVTLFFVGHAVDLYHVGLISQLDNIVYHARLRLTMPGGVDQRIVIPDIE